MKQFILVLILLGAIIVNPNMPKADTAKSLPCTLVLEPVKKGYPNAKGAALVYKVKLTPSFPRTSISIHAIHLPEPATFGKYDIFEGFAFIPNEISWRFKLYPSSEKEDPTWSGRIDEITAAMKNVKIQVRPSNSKTDKLGPPVLSNSIKYCK
ncbi:hypothetical protein [Lederbergia citrea]|uniref:hypothetical protein n=1 Tax=Lederbergia citrea TaxID=2833581 RepID=UPI001BCA15C7|nr:hypothetical protein [Lederbergia citrea]MBS4205030.1 hypothetical protein [Lederbergia citrea]